MYSVKGLRVRADKVHIVFYSGKFVAANIVFFIL